ncbi:MAG: hypothetical protein U9O55_03750 [Patescibacteria group bacterium]|nr:hypothetical protein [Patescibacteria group bacterium]
MQSANIVDNIKKRKLEERTKLHVRNKVFGIEKRVQHFIGKCLVSFVKIVVQGKELTVKIHEIPKEIKPTVVSIQLGNKIFWKYPGEKEGLNNRTILYQYDGEYFLKILKGGSIKKIISIAKLV